MEKNISVIIFDFGNVLIDLDIPGFYRNVHELTGIQSDEANLQFKQIMATYERGGISTELFINQIIKISPNPVQAREVIRCWNSMLKGIKPQTLDLLKKLKKHYRTYILSNTNALHIDWVYDHLRTDHGVVGFENEYLDGAFYSHELKLVKPDPEMYKAVQSKLGVSPDNLLFVDDLEENVSGARNAGWHAAVHPARTPVSKTLQSYITLPV